MEKEFFDRYTTIKEHTKSHVQRYTCPLRIAVTADTIIIIIIIAQLIEDFVATCHSQNGYNTYFYIKLSVEYALILIITIIGFITFFKSLKSWNEHKNNINDEEKQKLKELFETVNYKDPVVRDTLIAYFIEEKRKCTLWKIDWKLFFNGIWAVISFASTYIMNILIKDTDKGSSILAIIFALVALIILICMGYMLNILLRGFFTKQENQYDELIQDIRKIYLFEEQILNEEK